MLDNEIAAEINNSIYNKKYNWALELYKKNIRPNITEVLLYASCKHSFIEGINLAAQYGAEFNIEKYGYLEIAISNNRLDILKLLVQKGADLFYPRKRYENLDFIEPSHGLLVVAAGCSNVEIMQYLLEEGLDIEKNMQLSFGWACSHNKIENVKFLKEKYDCDVNRVYRGGISPLSWSVLCNHKEVVELLFFYGADISVNNNDVYNHLLDQYFKVEEDTFEKEMQPILEICLVNSNDEQLKKLKIKLEEKIKDLQAYNSYKGSIAEKRESIFFNTLNKVISYRKLEKRLYNKNTNKNLQKSKKV